MIEARLTFCPVCHGDAEELVIGEVVKYCGDNGEVFGYGHPGGELAQALIAEGVHYIPHHLHEHEKAPAGEPCPDCAAEIALQRKQFEKEVIDGAIHWACEMCGLFGIVVANDSQGFAAGVREAAGVHPPNQIGVKFTNCHQHASDDDNLTIRH